MTGTAPSARAIELESIRSWLGEERIRYVHHIPERVAVSGPWPTWLPEVARHSFAAHGVDGLWSHQSEAAESLWAGQHTVITTGTSSGKSLGYAIPIVAATLPGESAAPAEIPQTSGRTTSAALRQRLRSPERPGTALYLSPTKALAHDQLRALKEWQIPQWRVGALDGDSDRGEREFARHHAAVVLSNPDMIHKAVLPRHREWADFLAGLRYVVIDEAHRYRGVFGAHVALVVRRLRRLCAEYGANPVFALASATNSEPAQSAAALLGVDADEVRVIDQDGSPRVAVTHVLAHAGGDMLALSASLLADLVSGTAVERGRQAIVFLPSRKLCELVALKAQEQLQEQAPEHTEAPEHAGITPRVAPYRGGLLAAERRELEAALSSGRLAGVAATNALELGVDIAGIDAVVIGGVPGSLAAYWQQAGRAGRRDRPAVVIALGGTDQRDTYVLDHPELIFAQVPPPGVLYPDNPRIMGPHLAAAAQELPLRAGDRQWFGDRFDAVVDALTRQGVLRQRSTGPTVAWFWTRPDRAVDHVDLRSQGRSVQILEEHTGRLVGYVDAAAADAAVHPGAVYLHAGESHLVLDLDHDDAIATVSTGSPGWNTQPQSTSSVRVLSRTETRSFGRGALHRGDVEVTSQVLSYLRRDEVTGEVWDDNPLDMPVRTLRTRGTWWTLPLEICDSLDLTSIQLAGAAHGAEHTAIGLLGLFVPCDRWDVGGLSTLLHPDTEELTVFVHDGHPGGAGFADLGFQAAERWWQATIARLRECPCDDGCPACVISPKCGNANQVLDKRSAITLLNGLLGT